MKKLVGLIGMLFGGCCLSLEIFMLMVIQRLDKMAGSWYTNLWAYAEETPCLIAFAITAAVIVVSAILFIRKES